MSDIRLPTGRILVGDVLDRLHDVPSGTIQTCVTSPPYFGLRDYGVAGQIGLEATPEEYIARMVEVFRSVRRVLRDDGTLWLNIGDSYNAYNGNRGASTSFQKATEHACPTLPKGHGLTTTTAKNKDLLMIPAMLALALRADGWYLRSDIIWSKPNPMPESVTDRPTSAHEHIFLLAKSATYFYDAEAIKEPCAEVTLSDEIGRGVSRIDRGFPGALNQGGGRLGSADTRNRRNVWEVATAPYAEAHFATFPPNLIRPCIKAGSRPGDTALDPFMGSGTTGMVAVQEGRRFLGCELNPKYAQMAKRRILGAQPPLPLEATR